MGFILVANCIVAFIAFMLMNVCPEVCIKRTKKKKKIPGIAQSFLYELHFAKSLLLHQFSVQSGIFNP